MFAGSCRRLPGVLAWFYPTRSSSTLGCVTRTVNGTGFLYHVSPSASTRNDWNHPTASSHHAPGWHVRRLHMSSMFREEIRVVNAPAFAESVTEGDVRWEKAVGDVVKEDEVVCEIETDKTSIQVPAPAAGILAEFLIPDGGKVETGVALFKLQLSDAAVAQDAGGPVSKPARTPSQPPPSQPPPSPSPPVADEIPSTMPPVPPIPTKPMHVSPGEEIRVVNAPAFAESVTEGDVRWEKAVGDVVKEDEVVCEIETDKTSIQVPAPAAGILAEFLIPDGGKVETGVALFKLQLSDAAVAQDAGGPVSKPARTPSQPPPSQPPPSPPPPVADEIPSTMPPVPPIPTKPMHVIPVADIKVTPGASASVIASDLAAVGSRSEHRVRMSRMRQRTAQRLKEAQNTCALLTTFNELDMSSVMEMRSRYKDTFLKKHGIKLGFMSAFVHASCYALQHEHVVNAVIDDESKEIVYRDYIDISIAVATPKGLTVPVIRNVETMDYAGIEKAIHELGEKARKGELAIEDMDGGTFTISNGGVFGSLYGTPIVNPPQSAILGMHAIKERPVVIDGKVEIRPMMYIALTYDHRLIDGREAVTFLCKIKDAVEDPRMILLNI